MSKARATMGSMKYFLVLLATLLVTGCTAEENETGDVELTADTAETVEAHDSVMIELTGRDSVSVLDILVESHEVDFTSSSMGAFVQGIDSVQAGDGYYWLYSVNDTMAKVAADKYVASEGDVIRWYLRKSGE